MKIDAVRPRIAAILMVVCLPFAAGAILAQGSGAGLRMPELKAERIPLNTAVPEYPEDARRERLEGEATVCFSVDEDGEVVRPRISSATDRVFRKPTLDAIRASTFRPLEADALDVPFQTCRTYRYTLNRLEPLYVAEESAPPEAPATDNSERVAVDLAAADSREQAAPTAMAAADSSTLITEAEPLPPAEPVCRTATRPGTRIEYTYCLSAEQQAEADAAAGNSVRTLQDESRFRDQAVEEALTRGSYPRGPGLGPR